MEITQQPGGHVWNPNLRTGVSVTWTGECVGGFAQGAGTLTWTGMETSKRQPDASRTARGQVTGYSASRMGTSRKATPRCCGRVSFSAALVFEG